MKSTTVAHKRREENIKAYKRDHPKVSLRSMGKIFKLSHTWIAKILKESNGSHED